MSTNYIGVPYNPQEESSSLAFQLPDAPEQNTQDKFTPPASPLNHPKVPFDKLGFALTLANTAGRGLDAYSTRRDLNQGNREQILPNAIAGNNTGMGLYSAGLAGLDALAQHLLVEHGHPKLGHLLTALDAGSVIPTAIHNLTLKPQNGFNKVGDK